MMRPSLLRTAAQHLRRRRDYSAAAAQPDRKVAILGAAGGIGQPLALLMKLNPLVSSLSLYDIAGTPGVAADVSHINTPALVRTPYRPLPRFPLDLHGLTLTVSACR
jgi:malate dehydrogenase